MVYFKVFCDNYDRLRFRHGDQVSRTCFYYIFCIVYRLIETKKYGDPFGDEIAMRKILNMMSRNTNVSLAIFAVMRSKYTTVRAEEIKNTSIPPLLQISCTR